MYKNKGFTLIEVIVVSLIAGFVGMGVIFSIANSNKIINNSVKQSLFNKNAEIIFNEISKDIRGGVMLTVSDPSSETGYFKTLAITYTDGTLVEWYSQSMWLYRKGRTGQIRTYDLIGITHNDTYFEPHFKTPEQEGVYWGTEVKLIMWARNSGLWFVNNSATNAYYCRKQDVSGP